jgi:hypothetical protein
LFCFQASKAQPHDRTGEDLGPKSDLPKVLTLIMGYTRLCSALPKPAQRSNLPGNHRRALY